MAHFVLNPSAANGPGLKGDYVGNGYEVQSASLPRTRASSFSWKGLFWHGNAQADEALLPGAATSYESNSKDAETAVRAVSQTPPSAPSRNKRRRLQGWRFGVTVSAWTAFTVLLLNVIFTIYAGVKFPLHDGVGTAFDGQCDEVNSWTTWLHIAINALSSILLSASNYTMQCLCSPTRNEVDKAHARGDWLDIGVASVRNIWRVCWRRTVLWWLLGLSSVPIHLLYNSAVFKTLEANEYYLVVANERFLQGDEFAPWYNVTDSFGERQSLELYQPEYNALREVQSQFTADDKNESKVRRLTNGECMTAYATSFVSEYRNVLAITSAVGNSTNNTMLYESLVKLDLESGSVSLPYAWICKDDQPPQSSSYSCDLPTAKSKAAIWTINDFQIDYCLAQTAQPHCKLQFSVQILATVIAMNACKAICMFLTVWKQREATLVTIGDAITSFLDQPDEFTRNRCLMGNVDVDQGPLRWKLRGRHNTPNTEPLPITYYAPLRRRWFGAASLRRWLVAMTLCIAALITASVLLGIGTQHLTEYISTSQAFAMGFGSVDSRALVNAGLPQDGSGGLISAVLLANLPQAIVSFLYLTYNGLFTCMLLAYEYSKFGLIGRRKALRVTTPRGEQKSSYWLQLPYWYSVPLIVASALLHWLISQSIFLARISVYDYLGQATEGGDFSEVGYSCTPILCAILLGTVMLLVALGSGCRKLASHIPLASSCSVAISAACHRPQWDEDAAFLPVQWGEVYGEGDHEVGHCCFTSEAVEELTPGRMYAGSSSAINGSRDAFPRRRER